MAIDQPDDRISKNPIGNNPIVGDAKPYDELPRLGGGGRGSELSSLAQSARQKQLKSARTTMIVVGILTIVLNVAMLFLVKSQIDDQVRKAGFDVRNPPPQVQAVYFINYAIVGVFTLLGVVFIVLGLMVHKYPVPCTVAGLVLYILGWVVSVLIGMANGDPSPIWSGIIIKVIIIALLVKAVQAAIAYERESKAMLES